MDVLIPDQWKKDVHNVLHSGDLKRIIMRESTRLDWSATFPGAWYYDLFEAIKKVLRDPTLTGKQKYMLEPGEAYAFWFYYEGRKLLGKICLTPARNVIFMYSAHPPRKGDEL